MAVVLAPFVVVVAIIKSILQVTIVPGAIGPARAGQSADVIVISSDVSPAVPALSVILISLNHVAPTFVTSKVKTTICGASIRGVTALF